MEKFYDKLGYYNCTDLKAKYKKDDDDSWYSRGSSTKPTTAKGINTFTWNLRYPGPTTFDGIIIWGGSVKNGPKAPLGADKVKMKVGDEVVEELPFNVVMDPNLKGITAEDLDKQFELASKITKKASIANEAVIQIRSIRKQLDSIGKGISSKQFKKLSGGLMEPLTVVEEDLYQVRNQSGQDPLNFPIKLNNRFISLQRSIENGDAKPTDASYVVFDELSKELDIHIGKLNSILGKQLPKVNAFLKKNGSATISLE